jgi:DNA-binding response OmpR family regulator
MKKRLKALVVDDDELAQEVLKYFLFKEFEVYTVGTVNSFYSIISKIDFDIIFMDIMLHDTKDGIQLITELRANPKYKSVPILILTTHDSTQVKMRALNAGADKFINKPIFMDQLAKIIEEVLSQKIMS